MASRKENLKSLFSNTRTRVIIVFTAALLLLAVVIGYVKLRSIGTGPESTASVTNAPGGIRSIPGALDPTEQYATLQEQQNVDKATQAATTGGSAIPTIIKTQTLGQGVGIVGAQGGQGGVGFTTLAQEDEAGAQKNLWIQSVKNASCSKTAIDQVIAQGAQLSDLKSACSCVQLKDSGYTLSVLESVCQCPELKAAGFNARQLKDTGYTAGRLRDCGFDACELRNAGFTAQEMKEGGFSDGELKGAGYSDEDIAKATGLPNGILESDVRNAGCDAAALEKLRLAGVTVSSVRRINGCSAAQYKAAGYKAKDLLDGGLSAAELKNAGFTPTQLEAAGAKLPTGVSAGQVSDCSVDSLKKARLAGVSAATIRATLGCSVQALKDAGYTAKDLKAAGYTAAELKNAGFNAKDLKDAGYSPKELKDAGFSAKDLKDAGFNAQQLKDAGFGAKDLLDAGFTPKELKAAGFSAKDLKDAGLNAQQLKEAGFAAKDLKEAGFTPKELKDAGFSAKELKDAGISAADLLKAGFAPNDLLNAGFSPEESQVAGLQSPNLQQQGSTIGGIPNLSGTQQTGLAGQTASSNQQLQNILDKQNRQAAEQKYQQKIQQKTSEMLTAANQSIQDWKKVSTQVYTEGTPDEKKEGEVADANSYESVRGMAAAGMPASANQQKALIKTGDILFAVLDTSVNSDEPGPILATIVSGKLKGTKLIGSFNLPSNSDKMVISFNTMSVPGAAKTTSISAYAIDPNTARTALSSRTNHHYMMRYGSLFASSFLEGLGNAFQSADTTVTVGGTGGGNNITVQNGIGRSTLENAVIGLATVGKSWGQQAQQLFSTPTTVEVYSGTGLGILFTQDVTTI